MQVIQQLNVMGDSESTLALKRKADSLSISYDISIFISDTVIFLLTYVKYLIIIDYESLNHGVK